MVKPLKALQPSHKELMADAGFMLWVHPGSSNANAETAEIGRWAKQRVFADLQAHYQKFGLEQRSAKLVAELMAVVNVVYVGFGSLKVRRKPSRRRGWT